MNVPLRDRPSSTSVHAQSLERHVHTRDLGVPLQHDTGGAAAPDRQPFRRLVEIDDALCVLAVPVEQEGAAETLGREARLELGGGGAMHPVHPRGGGPSLSSPARAPRAGPSVSSEW